MEFKIKNVTPFEQETRDFTINWNSIESIYKGRLNACSCGCAGDYLYTQHYADYRSQKDGNVLLLDLTNPAKDRIIQEILTRVFLNKEGIKYQRDNDGWIFEIETEHVTDSNEHGWEEEVIKGYRIYSKFSPFKIK